jgi:hypothetical protein
MIEIGSGVEIGSGILIGNFSAVTTYFITEVTEENLIAEDGSNFITEG